MSRPIVKALMEPGSPSPALKEAISLDVADKQAHQITHLYNNPMKLQVRPGSMQNLRASNNQALRHQNALHATVCEGCR